MKTYLCSIFLSYILTVIIVDSNLLYAFREKIKSLSPSLYKGPIKYQRHLVDCRLCIGFYISILSTIYFVTTPTLQEYISLYACTYGGMYFLSTQER